MPQTTAEYDTKYTIAAKFIHFSLTNTLGAPKHNNANRIERTVSTGDLIVAHNVVQRLGSSVTVIKVSKPLNTKTITLDVNSPTKIVRHASITQETLIIWTSEREGL